MVKVVLVFVEPVDSHGQEPATLIVILGIGVHHPLVAWLCDEHRSGLVQEMHVEAHIALCVGEVALRCNADLQAFVVKLLTGIYFHRLFHDLARVKHHSHASTRQRSSVDEDFGALGIELHILNECEHCQCASGSLRLLTLIGEIDLEAGRVANGHTTHTLPVERNLRIRDFLCPLIEDGAWVVHLCAALIFPHVGSGTSACAIDETAWIDDIRVVHTTVYMIVDNFQPIVEIVVVEHLKVFAVFRSVGDLCSDAIDIEEQVTLGIHRDSKALLTGVVVGTTVSASAGVFHHRSNAKVEGCAGKIQFYAMFFNFIVFLRSITGHFAEAQLFTKHLKHCCQCRL